MVIFTFLRLAISIKFGKLGKRGGGLREFLPFQLCGTHVPFMSTPSRQLEYLGVPWAFSYAWELIGYSKIRQIFYIISSFARVIIVLLL